MRWHHGLADSFGTLGLFFEHAKHGGFAVMAFDRKSILSTKCVYFSLLPTKAEAG